MKNELVETLGLYLGWLKTDGVHAILVNGVITWSPAVYEETRNEYRSRAREVIALCKSSPTKLQRIWDAVELLSILNKGEGYCWSANELRELAVEMEQMIQIRDEVRQLISLSSINGVEAITNDLLERFTLTHKHPVTT